MRFLENEITQNPERGQLDHSFDVGCWIRANSRISRTERGQPCPRSSIISTRYRARQSRPRSLLNQPWMLDVCWVLGVGCWVLGVGCWVLGVGCWVLDVGCWMLDVGCWMFDVFHNHQLGLLRQTLPHCLRPSVRPRL